MALQAFLSAKASQASEAIADKHPVITTDVPDFKIYRRGRREMIPLLHPPS